MRWLAYWTIVPFILAHAAFLKLVARFANWMASRSLHRAEKAAEKMGKLVPPDDPELLEWRREHVLMRRDIERQRRKLED